MLVNVPALIALHRAIPPSFAVTPRRRLRWPRGPWPKAAKDEWLLNAIAQGFLAVAEWLPGRLAEAEHAFAASIAGWREAGQLTPTAWGCYNSARSSAPRAASTRRS